MEQDNNTICGRCGLSPLALGLKHSPRLVAQSVAMQEALRRAARFARSDAPVVVLGETGSGKEVVARVLHANSSRCDGAFVAVNVAALPEDLLESELFGHGKGAFTGATSARRGLLEEADGGTLFLDEIAEMPLSLQAKLLRALQDGEVRRVGENRTFRVSVRIICATHREILERVRAGLFREDLYFRLKVLTVRTPPLRERREDILPLAHQFLRDENGPAQGFSAEAEAGLLAYGWPGNVRELQNAVRHGVALAAGPEIALGELPDEVQAQTVALSLEDMAPDLRSLEEVEREHILRVLKACGGSQGEAANVLGIGRTTLWRKLNQFSEVP